MSDYSFEIKKPSDFLKKLHIEQIRYQADTLSSVDAMNFAWTAWHLTEWVWKGHLESNRQSAFTSVNSTADFKNYVCNHCPEMRIMRDIANGSKHFRLDRNNPKVQGTELHMGSFDNSFSRAFDISTLDVVLDDSSLVYFEDTIQPVIDFWDNFFATYSIP